MPTRYAALVWNRVLYLDELDSAKVYEFYTRYGEVVKDGQWVSPPEPQCTPPSPSPEPSASAEASPSASASPAPSASAAAPSVSAVPSSEPSPSPSAS
jgi:hypothetical protein